MLKDTNVIKIPPTAYIIYENINIIQQFIDDQKIVDKELESQKIVKADNTITGGLKEDGKVTTDKDQNAKLEILDITDKFKNETMKNDLFTEENLNNYVINNANVKDPSENSSIVSDSHDDKLEKPEVHKNKGWTQYKKKVETESQQLDSVNEKDRKLEINEISLLIDDGARVDN